MEKSLGGFSATAILALKKDNKVSNILDPSHGVVWFEKQVAEVSDFILNVLF